MQDHHHQTERPQNRDRNDQKNTHQRSTRHQHQSRERDPEDSQRPQLRREPPSPRSGPPELLPQNQVLRKRHDLRIIEQPVPRPLDLANPPPPPHLHRIREHLAQVPRLHRHPIPRTHSFNPSCAHNLTISDPRSNSLALATPFALEIPPRTPNALSLEHRPSANPAEPPAKPLARPSSQAGFYTHLSHGPQAQIGIVLESRSEHLRPARPNSSNPEPSPESSRPAGIIHTAEFAAGHDPGPTRPPHPPAQAATAPPAQSAWRRQTRSRRHRPRDLAHRLGRTTLAPTP